VDRPSASIDQRFLSRIDHMRMPRMLQEGARYHVSARANRQEMIFDSDEMKYLFLSVVNLAKRKFVIRIENFCLMGNHFHFMIRPGMGESLSSIMQWILSVFAMRFNRTHRLTGRVWGERFFSADHRKCGLVPQDIFLYRRQPPCCRLIDPR
jgi:REP element-mobilizing transposase RayT